VLFQLATLEQVQSAISTVNLFDGVADSLVPKSASSFIDKYAAGASPKHLQASLSSAIARHSNNSILDGAIGTRDKARLLSVRASGASLWLGTRLDIPSRRLRDFEFSDSIRFRFGINPAAGLPDRCSCGFDLVEYAWHAIDCPSMARFRLRLHNSLLLSARSWFNLLSAFTEVEPKDLHVAARLDDSKQESKGDQRKLRWDTSSTMISGRVLASDFTVLDSLAPSHLSKASSESLAVAERAAQLKVEKYQELVEQRKVKFFPVAFEMTGGLGKGVSEFVKAALAEAADAANWAPSELVYGIKTDWAVAVQRLRARLVQHWSLRRFG
jgi:hypothetical protein